MNTNNKENRNGLIKSIREIALDRLTEELKFYPSQKNQERLLDQVEAAIAKTLVNMIPDEVFKIIADDYDFDEQD